MGTNHFDKTLSPETRERVERAKSFHSAQSEVNAVVSSCEKQRKAHKAAWEKQKREHHARRMEHATEREDSEGNALTTAEHERQAREDDKRFAHIRNEDQLLELPRHEDYLQGRRALQRRKQVQQVEVTVQVEPETPSRLQNITGLQVWGAFWALVFCFVFVKALAESAGAIILLPVLVFVWCWLVRLPGYTFGGIAEGGGGRGGGNAV